MRYFAGRSLNPQMVVLLNNFSYPTRSLLYAAMKGCSLEEFLIRLDKMGMAVSIEGHVPMLGYHSGFAGAAGSYWSLLMLGQWYAHWIGR